MACVFLLALASGRAFVPGLCANIGTVPPAQEPVYGADSFIQPLHPCCAEAAVRACDGRAGTKAHAPVRLPELADCAFCKLAALRAEPLEMVAAPLPALAGFAEAPRFCNALPRTRPPAHFRGRAPPCLPASFDCIVPIV